MYRISNDTGNVTVQVGNGVYMSSTIKKPQTLKSKKEISMRLNRLASQSRSINQFYGQAITPSVWQYDNCAG